MRRNICAIFDSKMLAQMMVVVTAAAAAASVLVCQRAPLLAWLLVCTNTRTHAHTHLRRGNH